MPRSADLLSAIPACPRGHRSTRTVRGGTYGKGDKQRQMWWCHPDNGEDAHRFAEALPREVLAAVHTCDACETKVATFEGPQHPRQYEFAARHVAEALVAIGAGGTYRHASETARRALGKVRTGAKKGPNGTLVGDWVASFAPVVTAPVFAEETWPEVVAFDELPFGTTLPGPGRRKQKTQWVIFGAYAHPRPGQPGYLFRLKASPTLDAKAAAAWMTSIPGRPKYVVADGSKMWPKAVALAWPQVVDPATGEVLEEAPRLLPCQYHLHQRLLTQLRATGVVAPRNAGAWARPKPSKAAARRLNPKLTNLRIKAAEPGWYDQYGIALRDYPEADKHPLSVAGRRAFTSVQGWDDLLALARKWQAGHLLSWMATEGWIRDAIATHPAGVPRSIGGLEGQLNIVRRNVSYRSRVLRNEVRTQRMLDLMTLHLRNLDRTEVYAHRIRQHLEAHTGVGPRQRVGVTGGARLY